MNGNENMGSRLPAWLARLRPRLTRRHLLTVGGAVAAVMLAVFLAGVTTPPERRSASTGEDLFGEIMAQYPDLRGSSRVVSSADGNKEGNQLVLPVPVWERLQPEQRNSLASWLNEIGGDWVIRVGTVSPDGKRIRAAQAVITSREWNRQLK